MTPVERFEFWTDYNTWMLSIGIDFRFKSAAIIIGPYGVQYNWNA